MREESVGGGSHFYAGVWLAFIYQQICLEFMLREF